MGLWDKILGREKPEAKPPEHAVLVYFEYGSTDLSRLFALEEILERVILEADVGEFDGDEMATDGSDGTLFMYGANADTLFDAIRSTLEAAPFMKGARIVLRYGPPVKGVSERRLILTAL